MSKKSEDVIDLSSEDESEPAPLKKPTPVPNAMVHIPQKFCGVSTKPVKPNPMSIQKALAGKPVTLTKVSNKTTNKIRINGKQISAQHSITIKPMPMVQNVAGDRKVIRLPPILPHQPIPVINPLNTVTSQVTVKKITPRLLINPVRIQNLQNKLPASITVTRTSTTKRKGGPGVSSTVKKKVKTFPISTDEVQTVDLDDYEATPTSSGPQWYMRPEEQSEQEEKNNAEPGPANMIEITIEDSPVKPHNNQPLQVGVEFAITIDESPAKGVDLDTTVNGSDEDNTITSTNKEPQSKKKLEYPSDPKVGDVYEIELVSAKVSQPRVGKTVTYSADELKNQVVIIGESPTKKEDDFQTSPPQPKFKLNIVVDRKKDVASAEFHPVYQQFIDLCMKLENSDDMNKIVEKKIKAYYKQVPKAYTESEDFIDMISSKIDAITAAPERMYLYIKDVVDELNLQRRMTKSNTTSKDPETNETDNYLYGEESEFDAKRKRQIRKLEKTLKKLHRAIHKLEEQEVDFDDEEDSVYLLTERYKERMVRVHAKFCQLTNTKMPSEPRVQIEARPGQPKGPAKRLERWINKKVPIGTPLPFPDFHDVLRCVRDANEEDNLCWNDADIMDEARDLFVRCGKRLQRRRQDNEWRLAASRIQTEQDPAENNEELKNQLDQNQKLAAKRETEVYNKFADRQNQLKLEAVEIGDKEAEESSEESGDDDVSDETIFLENTEKRKERLKRLLQEKSKKLGEKDDQSNAKSEPKNSQHDVEMDLCKEIEPVNESEKEDASIDTNNIKDNISQDVDQCNDNDKLKSFSGDSNTVGSDVDELHLLQKLYSENENATSTMESSDSEGPIAISDTLDTDSDNKGRSDVISIENSSFSEAENKDDTNVSECEQVEQLVDTIDTTIQIEYNVDGSKKIQKQSNNDEYNESIEDILLASSDDEAALQKDLTQNKHDESGDIGDIDMIMEKNEHNNGSKEHVDMEAVREGSSQKYTVVLTSEEVEVHVPPKDVEDHVKNDLISAKSIDGILLTDNTVSTHNKPEKLYIEIGNVISTKDATDSLNNEDAGSVSDIGNTSLTKNVSDETPQCNDGVCDSTSAAPNINVVEEQMSTSQGSETLITISIGNVS